MTLEFNDNVTADDDVLKCDILADQKICNGIMQGVPQESDEDSNKEAPAST